MRVFVDGEEVEFKKHEETGDTWIKVDGKWRHILMQQDAERNKDA